MPNQAQNDLMPDRELSAAWGIKAVREANSCANQFTWQQLMAQYAAQWGWEKSSETIIDDLRAAANAELEMCAQYVSFFISAKAAKKLIAARRPPQTDREKALELLDRIKAGKEVWSINELDVIYKALDPINDQSEADN